MSESDQTSAQTPGAITREAHRLAATPPIRKAPPAARHHHTSAADAAKGWVAELSKSSAEAMLRQDRIHQRTIDHMMIYTVSMSFLFIGGILGVLLWKSGV